ncbi:putative quinol monooxygenase [Aeromicrobium sp. CF3.5]|uniref:putative quinol monooxygenase n=1 Tax=Aeromicrobium sp. CF3.5 TaxID=3373078 RepID=UPI003EE6E701
MILITVKTKVKPGTAEEYLAANRPFLEATRREPGNKWFEQYRSVDEPDTILTSEAFDDAAAGEAHVNSEHFQEFLANPATKPFVAETPDIIYVDVPDQDGWGRMAEF